MTTKTLRTVLGVAFVAVLLGLGLLGRLTGTNTGPAPRTGNGTDEQAETETAAGSTADIPSADADQPRPDDPVRISGDGFARTELGARAAAVSYLEATEEIVALTPAEAADAQRSISTTASAERLAGQVEEQMVNLAARTPQGVQVWLAPMEARSTEIDGGYEVSIWYAEVVAIGTATAVDNWRTITYTLLWENSTWLIEDTGSVVGPVPARGGGLIITPPSMLVSLLAAFDDQGLVP